MVCVLPWQCCLNSATVLCTVRTTAGGDHTSPVCVSHVNLLCSAVPTRAAHACHGSCTPPPAPPVVLPIPLSLPCQLITRLGAGCVATVLPPLVAAVRGAGLPVVWLCDPMHGNTTLSPAGVKTRDVGVILEEVQATARVHASCGSALAGVHLELTPEDVTECTGGPHALGSHTLLDRQGGAGGGCRTCVCGGGGWWWMLHVCVGGGGRRVAVLLSARWVGGAPVLSVSNIQAPGPPPLR